MKLSLHCWAQGTTRALGAGKDSDSHSRARDRGCRTAAEAGEARHPPLRQQFVHFLHEAAASAPAARPVRVRLGGPAGAGASGRIFRLRERTHFSLLSVQDVTAGRRARACGRATPTAAVLEGALGAIGVSASQPHGW